MHTFIIPGAELIRQLEHATTAPARRPLPEADTLVLHLSPTPADLGPPQGPALWFVLSRDRLRIESNGTEPPAALEVPPAVDPPPLEFAAVDEWDRPADDGYPGWSPETDATPSEGPPAFEHVVIVVPAERFNGLTSRGTLTFALRQDGAFVWSRASGITSPDDFVGCKVVNDGTVLSIVARNGTTGRFAAERPLSNYSPEDMLEHVASGALVPEGRAQVHVPTEESGPSTVRFWLGLAKAQLRAPVGDRTRADDGVLIEQIRICQAWLAARGEPDTVPGEEFG